MYTNKSNTIKEYKVNPYYAGREHAFFCNPKIEAWNKVLHLLIKLERTGSKHKLFISNTGIMIMLQKSYGVTYRIDTIKHAIRKLRLMGILKPAAETEYHVKDEDLRLTNGRILEFNTNRLYDFLRVNTLEDNLYKNSRKKSRERRLIRKKMYTIFDYVNMKKAAKTKSYRNYVKYQQKKYYTDETIIKVDPQKFMQLEKVYMEVFDEWMDEVDIGVYNN